MAKMMDVLPFNPILPRTEDIQFDQVVIRYDREADILNVHLFGIRPGVMLDVDDHLLLRIDPESHKVVGLQIEAYLLAAVHKQPSLLNLAAAAGIPDEEIEAIRRRLKSNVIVETTLRSLLNDLHLQPA